MDNPYRDIDGLLRLLFIWSCIGCVAVAVGVPSLIGILLWWAFRHVVIR